MLRPNFSRTYGSRHEMASGTEELPCLKPHKRWNDEGVASTVGTIMAMMVFLAALSMFTSQYVPVWMEENEASHMANAYSQFATLKQGVDMQVLAGTIQGTANVQMFSPVKLGAEGIPMFAAPTPGYLSISRSNSYDNVSFNFNTSAGMGFNASASVQPYEMKTGGSIKLRVENRYYIVQELAFENDALILKQEDGQYMKATPQLSITGPLTGPWQITYTQIDLRGDDINYIGFGTRGIKTVMKSTSTTTFTNLTSDPVGTPGFQSYPLLYINHTTLYGRAWNASFEQTLSNAGLKKGVDYNITLSAPKPIPNSIEFLTEVSVQINPNLISRFSLTIANIEISTSELGAA